MKPFSTPVLSKRTYRELKLLKHLKHENVGLHQFADDAGYKMDVKADGWILGHFPERYLHLSVRGYVSDLPTLVNECTPRTDFFLLATSSLNS